VSFLTATIVTHYATKTHASITSQDLSLPKAVHRGVYWPSDHAKRGKKFSPSFFSCLDWLCTALLTGRLSLSDVLEMALLWALLTVTVTH